jgi:hypothetical protein
MFRIALIGAAVVVVGIGCPSAAKAYPSACGPGTYQNAYGVCLPISGPDWSASVSTPADAEFFRLLTEPNQERPMVVWDYPGMKAQALWACQQMAYLPPYNVTKQLQANVGYVFDAANSITSAAVTAYCPQNGYAPLGKWPSAVPPPRM